METICNAFVSLNSTGYYWNNAIIYLQCKYKSWTFETMDLILHFMYITSCFINRYGFALYFKL